MTTKQIEDFISEASKVLEERRELERAQIKKKMAEMAEQHGFSVTDLFGNGRPVKGGKSKSLGVPKYANPDNKADTWTGRGRKPNWLITRLKKGAKLSDFEI